MTNVKCDVAGWDSQMVERGQAVSPIKDRAKDFPLSHFTPASAFTRLRRWHERRRAYKELMALDDRLLCDIGLSRGEISAALNMGKSDRRNNLT